MTDPIFIDHQDCIKFEELINIDYDLDLLLKCFKPSNDHRNYEYYSRIYNQLTLIQLKQQQQNTTITNDANNNNTITTTANSQQFNHQKEEEEHLTSCLSPLSLDATSSSSNHFHENMSDDGNVFNSDHHHHYSKHNIHQDAKNSFKSHSSSSMNNSSNNNNNNGGNNSNYHHDYFNANNNNHHHHHHGYSNIGEEDSNEESTYYDDNSHHPSYDDSFLEFSTVHLSKFFRNIRDGTLQDLNDSSFNSSNSSSNSNSIININSNVLKCLSLFVRDSFNKNVSTTSHLTYGYNGLHLACQYGHLNIVEELIGIFKDNFPNIPIIEYLMLKSNSIHEMSPLMIACRYGHFDVVKYFVQTYPKLSLLKSKSGKLPLQISLYSGNDCLEIVRLFIPTLNKFSSLNLQQQIEFLLNSTDCNGDNLLIIASKENKMDVFEYLISLYRNNNIDLIVNILTLKNNYGNDALYWSYRNQHFELANYLRDEMINMLNICKKNTLNNIELFNNTNNITINGNNTNNSANNIDNNSSNSTTTNNIEYNTINEDIDIQKNTNEMKLLNSLIDHFMQCIEQNDVLTCDILMEKVGRFLLKTTSCQEWKYTPLHIACQSVNREIFYYLIDNFERLFGKDQLKDWINQTTNINQWTPLNLLCKHSGQLLTKFITAINNSNSNMNSNISNMNSNSNSINGIMNINNNINSKLILNEQSNAYDMMKILLEKGADYSIVNISNNRPIHTLAIYHGNVKMVKLLIEYGEDVNIRHTSLNGNTPLHLSILSGHLELVISLINDMLADETLTNFTNQNPRELAFKINNEDVCRFLKNNTQSLLYVINQNLNNNNQNNTINNTTTTINNMNVNTINNMNNTFNSSTSPQLDSNTSSIANTTNNQTSTTATAIINTSLQQICVPYFIRHVKKDNYILVQQLIKLNPNYLNCVEDDEWRYSCFHWIAQKGCYQTAQVLLKFAQEHFSPQIVKHLINRKSLRTKWTPLGLSAKYNHSHVAKLLLQAGSVMSLTTTSGNRPIHSAAFYNSLEVLKLLVEFGGEDVNVQDSKDQFTPLMMASQEGHIDAVRYLLSRGADVSIKSKEGDTALYWAYEKGHSQIVELFIRELERKNIREPLNQFFFKAVKKNDLFTVENMIMKNREYLVIREPDEWSYSPLHWCSQKGHTQMAQFLIEMIDLYYPHQANDLINARGTKINWTPIGLACRYNNLEIAKLLVKKKADFTIPTKNGNRPIHNASFTGHLDVVKFLLSCGESANVRDAKYGYTPLMCASKKGHFDLVKLLVEQYHADVHSINLNGKNALQLALDHQHDIIVKYLRDPPLLTNANNSTSANNNGTPLLNSLQNSPINSLLNDNNSIVDNQYARKTLLLFITATNGKNTIKKKIKLNNILNAIELKTAIHNSIYGNIVKNENIYYFFDEQCQTLLDLDNDSFEFLKEYPNLNRIVVKQTLNNQYSSTVPFVELTKTQEIDLEAHFNSISIDNQLFNKLDDELGYQQVNEIVKPQQLINSTLIQNKYQLIRPLKQFQQHLQQHYQFNNNSNSNNNIETLQINSESHLFKDLTSNQNVVIKMYSKLDLNTFIQHMIKLSNKKHILPILDGFEWFSPINGRQFCIVTEYQSNMIDLQHLITNSRKPISHRLLKSITKRLFEIVSNQYHGNLKLTNILISINNDQVDKMVLTDLKINAKSNNTHEDYLNMACIIYRLLSFDLESDILLFLSCSSTFKNTIISKIANQYGYQSPSLQQLIHILFTIFEPIMKKDEDRSNNILSNINNNSNSSTINLYSLSIEHVNQLFNEYFNNQD